MGEVVPLRDYIDVRFKAVDQRFEAQKEAVVNALSAAKEAVIKAEGATERRFENSNEWRNTVETLQRTYMPRTESEQQIKSLAEKVEANTARLNSKDDRGRGMGETWALLGAVIAVLVSLGTFAVMLTR